MRMALLFCLALLASHASAQERCGLRHQPTPLPPPPALQLRSPLTLPVVVHIVWHTAEENLSEAQVRSQIEVLNEDFRRLNVEVPEVHPLFDDLAADTEIEFCLTAITRTPTPVDGITNAFQGGRRRVCHTDLGGRDAIDPDHYINIWVAGRSDGVLGSATFPEEGQDHPLEDGLFIRPDVFGKMGSVSAPYDRGRTCTHEMGHYLNLQHLWGAGNDNFECEKDDGIADTPRQASNYRNTCPSAPLPSCGSPDMFMNFMNYTDDACMALFTPGQKLAMHAAIATYRSTLLQGSCDPVKAAEAAAAPALPRLLGNPVAAEARLDLPAPCQLAVFDAAGRSVMPARKFPAGLARLHVEDWDAGVYYIKIRHGAHLHFKKLIIAQ